MMRTRTNPGLLVCAGEFFFDIIFYGLQALPRLGEELVTEKFGLALGGGATITATVAARLGCRTELVSVLGTSALDAFAIGEVDRRGVGRKLARRSRKHSMGGVTVSVSTARDRYFLTANGANEDVGGHVCGREARAFMRKAQHVHFALSPRTWRRFPALLAELRKRGVTTSWDVGWRPEAMRDPDFRRTLAAVDVVFMNEREALRFAGKRSLMDALRKLQTDGQTLVVKLGSRGAVAMDADGRRLRSRGMKVNAVDTTGAGDAFDGGFLHLWMQGADVEECLRAGNVCGALSTRVAGGSAGAPTGPELKRLMRRFA
jgi:sugar/nucleoside kinase (ribokinase family)